jgi:hypothetical protein
MMPLHCLLACADLRLILPTVWINFLFHTTYSFVSVQMFALRPFLAYSETLNCYLRNSKTLLCRQSHSKIISLWHRLNGPWSMQKQTGVYVHACVFVCVRAFVHAKYPEWEMSGLRSSDSIAFIFRFPLLTWI